MLHIIEHRHNVCYFTLFGMPSSSFCMYSKQAIYDLVSFMLRRQVLLVLNSSMRTRLVLPFLRNNRC